MEKELLNGGKELLLKDLCARLPYGVKCKYLHIQHIENGKIIDINRFGRVNIDGRIKDICDIKPYLFPLSAMSTSEMNEIVEIMGCNIPWYIQYGLLEWTVGGSVESETFDLRIEQIERLMEFLNSHHIDYRGLIPMGLAIDATGLNIYKEETK